MQGTPKKKNILHPYDSVCGVIEVSTLISIAGLLQRQLRYCKSEPDWSVLKSMPMLCLVMESLNHRYQACVENDTFHAAGSTPK
mmetsp:Transcript_10356/g.23977  ORF Transcript_10356/g.23977 Transcript_10356/m.23977 type:complete len:84 (+) Transcript_10356:138-389(+)